MKGLDGGNGDGLAWVGLVEKGNGSAGLGIMGQRSKVLVGLVE